MKDFTNGLFKLPSKEERIAARAGAPLNPIKLAMMLTPLQGAMFFSGWLAWTMDAWDFFSVSLSVTRLAEKFGFTEATKVTTAITLTLLFRPLGALVFGLLSDRYGRKYPLVAALTIIAVLSLGTGFVETYSAFLGVRCLFGIFMGAIWGLATANALENMPPAPRGLFSGILQQGYAVGYLLAASVNLTWIARTNNWRYLFFLGAGLSLFAALVRLALPESELFVRIQRERAATGTQSDKARVFARETWQMIKTSWVRVIYGILLMTGFNFLSHSSQDLYPTMIQKTSLAYLPTAQAAKLASKATIIGNCGAVCGGMIAGYLSQYLGRRLTIVIFVVFTGAMIAPWILPTTFSGLAAGAFFVQFGVQGAWGVIPIYLSEISPPAYRATFPCVAYQLGNMVSSASAQIEATGGANNQIPNPRYTGPGSGQPVTIPNYAYVSAVLLGVVCAYILIVILFGKEYRGVAFEKAPVAFQENAGKYDPDDIEKMGKETPQVERTDSETLSRDGSNEEEKGGVSDREVAEVKK